MPPTTHLLYLHGFRSSPQSHKARLMAAYLAQQHPQVHWWCPQLPPSPAAAMALLLGGTADWPRDSMAVVGSSLGGFYATYLAQATGCRAVLVNPAVDPARDLARYIGDNTHWHAPEAHFYFDPAYVDELRALDCGPLHQPERLRTLIAQGDEVLDWREMHARYQATRITVLPGSSHAFDEFPDYLPDIASHLGWGPNTRQ